MRRDISRDRQEGSATVAGVSVILGIVALSASAALHLAGVVDQHRADSAADLVALSAATVQVVSGTGQACRLAAEVADANGAELTGCREIVGGGPDAPGGTAREVGVLVTVVVEGRAGTAAAGP